MNNKDESQQDLPIEAENESNDEPQSDEANNLSQEVIENTEQIEPENQDATTDEKQGDSQLGVITEVEQLQVEVLPLKKKKKRISLFKVISMTLIGMLTIVVIFLALQLTEREEIIQDTQQDLVKTKEELLKLQVDSKDMSTLVLEQQETIKQHKVDIEEYEEVVKSRDGEIAKLQTLLTETETKVVDLQKQLEQLDAMFTAFKEDIMGIVEEE